MQVAALFLSELNGMTCKICFSFSTNVFMQETLIFIRNLKRPCSVTLPAHISTPSFFSILAEQLQSTPSARSSDVVSCLKLEGRSVKTCSIVQNSLTVIWFLVSVPVLSVQIVSAPPIVSEDANLRTQLFSLFIFMTEKAKDIVTARGRPSGIAITMTVTAVMTAYRKSVRAVPSHNFYPTVLSKTALPHPRTKATRKK